MEVDESGQNGECAKRSNSHSSNSDSGSDDEESAPGNHNHQLFPPPPRNVGLPLGFGQQRGRLPFVPRQIHGLGGGSDDDDEMIEGGGHRLGGKEVPPIVGDLQMNNIRMHDAGKCIFIILCSLSLSRYPPVGYTLVMFTYVYNPQLEQLLSRDLRLEQQAPP